MISTKGVVTDIIFRNTENFYTIFIMDTDEGMITVVGRVIEINKGDSLSITGELVYHNQYGEQIKLKNYERMIPSSVTQIEKYLNSGIIPHIGEKTAKLLVKKFGEKTLEIMTNNPNRLLEIRGIGKSKKEKIHEAILKESESREILIFLQSFEIGNKLSLDIYAKYKKNTRKIIEENPYILIEDIRGIGFSTADKIAMKIGVKKESYFRIKAGVIHIITESSMRDGNCYLEYEELINETSNLLKIDRKLVDDSMQNISLEGAIVTKIKDEKIIVYSRLMYDMEYDVLNRLIDIIKHKKFIDDINVSDYIEMIEDRDGIKYSQMQKKAIKTAIEENIMIITGGPGTGKTTIIRAILSILEKIGLNYILCAPTGRAAKRMEESTQRSASTIHRMLGYKSLEEDVQLEFNENNLLDADVIIIDEISMVDIILMRNLLKAISNDTRLIFVGDADQLPSVGPGNVLNDMIESKSIPTIKLDVIFRQGEESNIVKNAHLINHGQQPILNQEGKDFFFINTRSDEETVEKIVELVTKRLPNHYDASPYEDIQVLTPTRKGLCGVENLNKVLQKELNTPEFNKAEIEYHGEIFREKDKIMQIKNNYDIQIKDKYGNVSKGLYNGDVGYIKNIYKSERSVEVMIEDKTVMYSGQEISEINLSYAVTIHKSQGSEFPIVVIPMTKAPYMLLTRNILYTGITRGKKIVVLVGNESIMKKMIENTYRQRRNSTLEYNLRKYFGANNEHK